MNLHRRKCGFTPSRFHLLVEIDGKLGYDIDGEFIPVCDAPKKKAKGKLSNKERLKKFLDESPHMRQLVAAGVVILSIDSEAIYCHSTTDFFKHHSASGKMFEGAELDAWAKARFEENERVIADLRQSGGRVPDGNKLRTIAPRTKKQTTHRGRDRDMYGELRGDTPHPAALGHSVMPSWEMI